MKIEITAVPKFSFTLEQADLDVLMTLSKHHYDARCRSYSQGVGEAGRNGLLVIWQMFCVSAEQTGPRLVEVTASQADLDTLLKCMEMPQCLQTPDELQRLDKLRKAFIGAMRHAGVLYRTWVDVYDSEATTRQATPRHDELRLTRSM